MKYIDTVPRRGMGEAKVEVFRIHGGVEFLQRNIHVPPTLWGRLYLFQPGVTQECRKIKLAAQMAQSTGFLVLEASGVSVSETMTMSLQGSPSATEPNQEDMLRGSLALCQGYPGAILPEKDSTWEEKEIEDSRRRSRRGDSAGKEVGIEDKARWRKRDVALHRREAVHRRQPGLVASYDPRQKRWSTFFPRAPHGEEIGLDRAQGFMKRHMKNLSARQPVVMSLQRMSGFNHQNINCPYDNL
ncbi:hypothetical protein PoB_006833500 [Plakobranchus ocellatus]|uniref:Uncharacterized protein n=1 Tax=Plakobranchus ocellatus TaxID=259542 RepID=A0AAV4DCM2_9GAST|nr:hypothetical protein PoB_006833500 [Plakobranchus ocellatus]